MQLRKHLHFHAAADKALKPCLGLIIGLKRRMLCLYSDTICCIPGGGGPQHTTALPQYRLGRPAGEGLASRQAGNVIRYNAGKLAYIFLRKIRTISIAMMAGYGGLCSPASLRPTH